MDLKRINIKTKNGIYNALYKKGTHYNNVAFLYYHGLNGNSKVVKPLLNYLREFDFYSIEERGHELSFQKASSSPRKHDKDIYYVVNSLKDKYEKIFLCGESMGALYVSRYAYKWDKVDAVFSWSIPFSPKDIMIENKFKKVWIISREIFSFFTGINFKYKSKINYPMLTDSKFLMKLHELNINVYGSTAEEVAIYKGVFSLKRNFLKKKPKVPIYYWQGTKDVMSSNKLAQKIKRKNNVEVFLIENGKHILMFDNNANLIFEKMLEIAKKK